MAFQRDRPDVTVDLLDHHPESLANTAPEGWNGEKYFTSMQSFTPTHAYDAIWAHNSLFLMSRPEQEAAVTRLVSGLKLGGKLVCTMIEDSHSARALRYSGWPPEEFQAMLVLCGLRIQKTATFPVVPHSTTGEPFPTYVIAAYRD